MINIGISVEGQTEFEFVNKVLVEYFLGYGITLIPIPMHGNISVDRIESEIKKLLPRYHYVTTFYDLYGFKKVGSLTAEELENKISSRLKNNPRSKRLIPYIQKYEFETLLFSKPSVYEDLLGCGAKKEVDDIIRSCGGSIENINNSKETAPSKRLEKLFNKYNEKYNKVFYGVGVIEDIGLDIILDKCDRFRDWFYKIQKLGINS
ncbi:MAG: Unknown protein [uncultured Campylobacterales bacterium]|uniref:DUF4276 family protein n=1 Tax=uncultured Campylobacterales bacterium TaxID=352960 RepID=A0A6S6SGY1_9BACT|nr:MAG: Unknown protein [uncultured Campylobacterales bacterium]